MLQKPAFINRKGRGDGIFLPDGRETHQHYPRRTRAVGLFLCLRGAGLRLARHCAFAGMVGAVGIIPVLQAQLIRQHVVAAELPLPMGEEVLRGGQGLQAKGRKAQGADTADGLLLGKRALRVGKFVEPREKALFRPLPKGDFSLSWMRKTV